MEFSGNPYVFTLTPHYFVVLLFIFETVQNLYIKDLQKQATNPLLMQIQAIKSTLLYDYAVFGSGFDVLVRCIYSVYNSYYISYSDIHNIF